MNRHFYGKPARLIRVAGIAAVTIAALACASCNTSHISEFEVPASYNTAKIPDTVRPGPVAPMDKDPDYFHYVEGL